MLVSEGKGVRPRSRFRGWAFYVECVLEREQQALIERDNATYRVPDSSSNCASIRRPDETRFTISIGIRFIRIRDSQRDAPTFDPRSVGRCFPVGKIHGVDIRRLRYSVPPWNRRPCSGHWSELGFYDCHGSLLVAGSSLPAWEGGWLNLTYIADTWTEVFD